MSIVSKSYTYDGFQRILYTKHAAFIINLMERAELWLSAVELRKRNLTANYEQKDENTSF